jgi:hypothetical protein
MASADDEDDKPLTPEEQRQQEVDDLKDDLEFLIDERAERMTGPYTANRSSKALERMYGGGRGVFVYGLALGAAGAVYVYVSENILLMLLAAGAMLLVFYGVAYAWEAVAKQRHWERNKKQIIADLDEEIDEVKKELFKRGVTGVDQPRR